MLEPLSILGIGSVPFSEGKNSCKEIFENWNIPYWPQYPKRSLRENFVFQFLSSFPGLKVTDKSATFNEAEFLAGEAAYRKALKETLTQSNSFSFEPPPDWALGYGQMKQLLAENRSFHQIIKLHITSPTTIWDAFFKSRVSKTLAPKVWEVLNPTLIASGLGQIRRVLSYGKIPLIFIDEPIRQKEISSLKKLVKAFKSEKALVGLHVCSNQDWSKYGELELDFFHFDITAYTDLASEHKDFLRELVRRKAWLAWGVVPSIEISASPAVGQSQNLLMWADKIAALDLSVEQILNQSLLALSCGTGTLNFIQEESIFEQLRTVSRELKYLKSHLGKKIKNQP